MGKLTTKIRLLIRNSLMDIAALIEPKKVPVSKFIHRMEAQNYIDTSRAYLDYIEEHVINVAKAFSELSDACDGKESWVGDDLAWYTLKGEVINHDLSKLSKNEFTQYRDYFYPANDADCESCGFAEAWENHKKQNHHHHETAENYHDITHMIIDWVAMSYKFGDNPRDFYEKTKPCMGRNITDEHHKFISIQFDHLESYRLVNGKQ